jgi:hypothetical protein
MHCRCSLIAASATDKRGNTFIHGAKLDGFFGHTEDDGGSLILGIRHGPGLLHLQHGSGAVMASGFREQTLLERFSRNLD